jgi:hypothetical protein
MKLFVKPCRGLPLHAIASWCAILLCGAPGALAQQGHALIAHYTFDVNSQFYQADSSGNNNNINGGSSWAAGAAWGWTTNAIAGGGALVLNGGENLTFGSPPGNQTFDNWLAMFYGSFSISVWVNTTNVVGNDSDDPDCCTGAQIIAAYNGGYNDTIPIALTGHKAAFFTGDPSGANGNTLHSTNDVTTGSWVHIVVTRDEASGAKTIYVNGVLDSSDTGTTGPLDGDINNYAVGGGSFTGYAGILDDLQLYAGVLSASDVAFLYANPGTTVTNVAGLSSGLVAFYDFDENTDLAADLTANGNNLIHGGNFGGPVLSSNSVSGGGAVYFNGGSFLTPSSNLLSTLAGDFSLSVWVETTQSLAWDTAPAFYGAGIVAADVPGTTNDLVPMALTGGAIGFNTGSGTVDDTVNSATDINDGHYHHVVVTRNQATGEKQIYIDGAFNTNDFAATGLLNAPQLITIGALANASISDPTSPEYSGYNGFVGFLDDIQIYSRVISSNEVAALFARPGSNATNGLAAHYDFDEGTVLAADVSGNSNDIVFAGSLEYNAPGPGITTNAESGPGALSFDGVSYLVPEGNPVSILAGDFSLSVWLQTSQSFGTAGDAASSGAGIVTAEVPDQSFDLAPLALTGGNIAFGTDGASHDTLTSTTPINDGNYHHVVVTRDQATGQKQIYLDGVLNNSDTADTSLLSNPQIVIFGAQADASQTDPNSPSLNASNGYVGQMDQVQLYSRVITSNEVAFLFNNPGATLAATNGAASDLALGVALDATNVSWSTSGNATWFVETTNTYSTNAEAAQSGSLQDGQSSLLQATVTGPGTISFYWQTMAGADDFDLEFDIDGGYQDDISGQTSWTQDSWPVEGSGTHTLSWNANTLAASGSSPTDAGFLDQVVFTPAVAPVITLNPFNQTNYPGYNAALLAGASGVPAPAWQWYEAGNPNPIPGATSALFIPATSGTSNVAGSYYAVAANIAGSQNTTTALVTFVSAPLPPDWTEAMKSPFVNYDIHGTYTANDVYHACLVDSTGTNIYSVGYSQGTNFFGTNEIVDVNGGYTAIIVKQTTAKAGLWVATVTNNGNGSAYGQAIAPAPGGGVYVAISFSGTNWLGNTLLEDSGAGSILLARFDASGNTIWVQTISATNGAFVPLGCLVADSSGNVTLAGVLSGAATIGGTNLTISGQTSFLAQFNENGTLNWVERVSNIIEDLQYSAGRVYASLLNWLSGNTNYTVGGLTNSMERNYTLAAINATNGQGLWLRGVGEAFGADPSYLIDDVPQIAVSGTNVFLAGTAYGSNAVFGSFTVPIAGGRGQYFARYDTDGNAQLATGFGSATTQPWAAVADASGNVYVAGDFDTYAQFGDDILAAPQLATLGAGYFGQAFVAEFNSAGTPLWARMAESTNETIYLTELVNFWNLALAPDGVWVCGLGNGAADFGTNLVNSSHELIEIGQSTYAECFNSGMLGLITLTEPASPVTLLNAARVGTNIQFSFVSTAEHTNYVQYSTNLASTNWLPYSTIVGDGTLKTVVVPANHPAAEFFRVGTQ